MHHVIGRQNVLSFSVETLMHESSGKWEEAHLMVGPQGFWGPDHRLEARAMHVEFILRCKQAHAMICASTLR